MDDKIKKAIENNKDEIILNNHLMNMRSFVNQFYELVECEAEEIRNGDITPHSRDNYTSQIFAICQTIQTMYERGIPHV